MKKLALVCTITISLSVLVGCGDSKKEENKVVDINNKPVATQTADAVTKMEDTNEDKTEVKDEDKKEESKKEEAKVELTRQEEKAAEVKKEEQKKEQNKEETKKESVKVDTNKKLTNTTNNQNVSNQNTNKTEKPSSGSVESTQNKKQNLVVYSYDMNNNIMSKTISVDKIDANVILNALKENKVLTSAVAINNININGRVAVIDFNEAFINRNLGSGFEAATLDCVAKTYLGGLNLDKIRFTVNGGFYESGHIFIGENDYYTR